jgi:hypothetical protein
MTMTDYERSNDTCPHCHRPYAPVLHVTGPVRRRFVYYFAGRPDGITIGELAELVYADRPQEPSWAANAIKGTVFYANKQLLPQGYRIKSSMGPGARYRLERVPFIGCKVDPASWEAMWAKPFDRPELL